MHVFHGLAGNPTLCTPVDSDTMSASACSARSDCGLLVGLRIAGCVS